MFDSSFVAYLQYCYFILLVALFLTSIILFFLFSSLVPIQSVRNLYFIIDYNIFGFIINFIISTLSGLTYL